MKTPKDREEILYAFAVEPTHDKATLDHYLRLHPELAADLVELSSDLRTSPRIDVSHRLEDEDIGAEEAWNQFIKCEVPSSSTAHRAGENPFARVKGQAFAELAHVLQVPKSILTPLRDRLIDSSSIPKSFLTRLAAALKSPEELLVSYFSRPPAMIGTAEFKSSQKPSPQGRISFKTLVEQTQMSDQERQQLQQDLVSDGLD